MSAQILNFAADSQLAPRADEWRLDGVIVRVEASGRAFWLRPSVVVLRDQSASLANGGARRVVVGPESRAWTPDGSARPLSPAALEWAMRRGHEVSVVGARGASEATLRARLIVLPAPLPTRPPDTSRAKRSAATRRAAPRVAAARGRRPVSNATTPAPGAASTSRLPWSRPGLNAREATATAALSEARTLAGARVGFADRGAPQVEARIAALAPAQPRDTQREQLRLASPRASSERSASSWRQDQTGPAAAPGHDLGRASLSMRAAPLSASERPEARAPNSSPSESTSNAELRAATPAFVPGRPLARAEPLGIRATPLVTRERREIAAPSLSSSTFITSSRLSARSLPRRKGAALDWASGEGTARSLARAQEMAMRARSGFAALRAMSEPIAWADFCGGPGSSAGAVRAASTSRVAASRGEEKMVALTFDDGPHPNTRRILDILGAHGARGTFFVVGRNVRRHPEVLLDIAARGHDVGNHSDTHRQGTRMDAAQWEAEVDGGGAAIAQVLGVAPRWFRAPGCRYTSGALAALRARRLVRVDSSNNSGDWEGGGPDQIVARVLSRLAPNQVLLFHDPLPHLVTALPVLLRELRARGYKCVTVSELASRAAQDPAFRPDPRPSGQGIVLPQVLAGAALSAGAPVSVQP